MRRIQAFIQTLSVGIATLGILAAAGCGADGDSRPAAVSAVQAPSTLKDAFKGASDEVRGQADAAGSALGGGDTPGAFFSLVNLSGRPDLTPEQREAAAAAMVAAKAKLAAAAAQGDARSREALEMYSSGK
jgi:hypothetical protein